MFDARESVPTGMLLNSSLEYRHVMDAENGRSVNPLLQVQTGIWIYTYASFSRCLWLAIMPSMILALHAICLMLLGLIMPRLPLTRELHQLAPVFARMLCPEALDTPNFVVFDFNRRIRLAHQRIPDKVDTIPNMWW